MSQVTWDELNHELQAEVIRLAEEVLIAFQGMAIPNEILAKCGNAIQPEINEIDQILMKHSWEQVDREEAMLAINHGTAVVNLCREELMPYVLPLFMSLALLEGLSGDQDDMFVIWMVESLRHGETLKKVLESYTPAQEKVVLDFIKLIDDIFFLDQMY